MCTCSVEYNCFRAGPCTLSCLHVLEKWRLCSCLHYCDGAIPITVPSSRWSSHCDMVVRLNIVSKCEAKKPNFLVSELYTLCFSTVLIFVPMVLQFQGCVNYNPLGGTTSHVPISKYRQHAKPQKSWNTTSPPCHIGYVAVREVLQHCVPNDWTIQLSFTDMWSPLHSLPYYTQSVSCRVSICTQPHHKCRKLKGISLAWPRITVMCQGLIVLKSWGTWVRYWC
jgi:hypothetical protein